MRAVEFKEAMRAGRPVVGFQQFLPSPALTEMAGLAGFDWVWLCIEHGSPAIGTDLEDLTRTCDGMGMTSIVRITQNDYPIIQRCLDLGANGVMVPRVRTRAEVEYALDCVKYPPLGTRGICGITRVYGYGARSRAPEVVNDETVVMLIIEQREAFDDLDGILSVPGVDCAIFGAGDLSLELGIRDQVQRGDPEALAIIKGYRDQFIESCRRHNVAMGEPIADLTKLPAMIEDGMTVLASRPDGALIMGAMTAVVQETQRASTRSAASARV